MDSNKINNTNDKNNIIKQNRLKYGALHNASSVSADSSASDFTGLAIKPELSRDDADSYIHIGAPRSSKDAKGGPKRG